DLDDLLGRVERLGDLFAEGALAHRSGELPHDGDGDVRVEQGPADLADRLVDVRLGEAAVAAKALQRRCDAIGEVVEDEALLLGRMDRPSVVRPSRRPPSVRAGAQERTATRPRAGRRRAGSRRRAPARTDNTPAASMRAATIRPTPGGSRARPC